MPPPVLDKKQVDATVHKENDIKVWNDSEVDLLKRWGEVASSYRFLHDRAFRIFQFRNYCFTIPVIVLSTISGTASFSIDSFPVNFRHYVPMIIGGVNIFVGIIQTIAQFLRISELAESHRAASTAYGKFSRNIATELSLPPGNRTYNGIDFVQMCRTDMDRLLEQSPIIPMNLLSEFDMNPSFNNITKPDVLKITEIKEYRPSHDERIQNIVSGAAEQLKHFNNGVEPSIPPVAPHHIPNMHNIINNTKDQALKKIEEHRKTELNDLGDNKIVSNIFGNTKLINNISKTFGEKPTPASLLKTIKKGVESRVNEEIENIEEEVSNVKKDVKNQVNGVKNDVQNQVNNVKNDVQNEVNNVKNDIENQVNSVKNDIENQVNNAKNELETTINTTINTTNDELNDTKKSINTKITKISSGVVQALDIEGGYIQQNNQDNKI